MKAAITKGDHYFYALKLQKKNAFKVGVSKNDFDRVKHHERSYGGINYSESFIAVSPFRNVISVLERQILTDYEDFSVAADFRGIDGYSEVLSLDCLTQIIEDVQAKAARFPAKKLRIIIGLELVAREYEEAGKKLSKDDVNIAKTKISKATLSKLYGSQNTDIWIGYDEKIPLFTFPAQNEDSFCLIGPRYFIEEGCYIIPRAANTLRTSKGRELMALFLKKGRKPDEESYILNYGEMADGLSLKRSIETLAWLQDTGCNLWCGAIIETLKGGCGGINYVGGTITPPRIKELLNSYYNGDVIQLPTDIWDLEMDINIGKCFLGAIQTWFFVPDISPELWHSIKFSGEDFFSKILSRHTNWQPKRKK